MNILLALLPAIARGIIPIIVNKVPNSKPANQILGIGVGAAIVGIIIGLTRETSLTAGAFMLSLLSGMFWTLGQVGQFVSFTKIGVSKTMPISTGLQLIGNTLIGALIFGEWSTSDEYIFGIVALLLIIIGVALTAINKQSDTKSISKQDMMFLIFTTIGYLIYSTFPKMVDASAETLFLPQTLGILLGSIVYLVFTKQLATFKQKASYWDIIAGFAFGIGALSYMLSAQLNGITSAFIYSQLSVIISTLGGMILLRERKYGLELGATIVGLMLIVVGAIM